MAETRFKLFYWPLPFRGCFVSYQLAWADQPFELADVNEVLSMMSAAPKQQHVPFVGPPVLLDRERDLYLSQMPAIVLYLAGELGLGTEDGVARAKRMKVLMDANDVLMEICHFNGTNMWQRDEWVAFRSERLPRWMAIFEESLKRGVIGGESVNFADIGTLALFGNMTRCLPELDPDLRRHAPGVHALCERLGSHPPLRTYRDWEANEWGTLYCGGQIEESVRAMIAQDGVDAT